MRIFFALGSALTAGFLLLAVLGTLWTPYDPQAIIIAERLQPPGVDHWLGTDAFGRDQLSRLLAGGGVSLSVALAAILIGAGVGMPLGLASAAWGGPLDQSIMRASDLIFAFPALITAVLLTASLGPGAANAILAIAIFNIPVFAKLARGAARGLMSQGFILAARTCGKSRGRIAVEHLLPNIADALIIQLSIQLSLAILAEAGLSYLGLGVQPPNPSWGRMLAEGQTLISVAPWLVWFPGLTIFLAVFGINMLGEGLRDRLGHHG